MVVIIKNNDSKATRTKNITKAMNKEGVNTLKYCGTIKLNQSPIDIQKELRSEWK